MILHDGKKRNAALACSAKTPSVPISRARSGMTGLGRASDHDFLAFGCRKSCSTLPRTGRATSVPAAGRGCISSGYGSGILGFFELGGVIVVGYNDSQGGDTHV